MDTALIGNSRRRLANEVPVRLGRSQVDPAAMRVNNRGSLSGLRRVGPPAVYPSNGRGIKSHTVWYCDSLHEVVERTAAGGSLDLAFHRRESGSQSGRPHRVFLA